MAQGLISRLSRPSFSIFCSLSDLEVSIGTLWSEDKLHEQLRVKHSSSTQRDTTDSKVLNTKSGTKLTASELKKRSKNTKQLRETQEEVSLLKATGPSLCLQPEKSECPPSHAENGRRRKDLIQGKRRLANTKSDVCEQTKAQTKNQLEQQSAG